MVDAHENDEREVFTPADMRKWLAQEIRDVLKELELRIKDATDFVTAYATGEIGEKEMDLRWRVYDRRWGDAIRGIRTEEGTSNEAIMSRLDEERGVNRLRTREASSRTGGRGLG